MKNPVPREVELDIVRLKEIIEELDNLEQSLELISDPFKP